MSCRLVTYHHTVMGNNLHVCYTQWQFYVGEGVSTAFRLSTTTVTWKKNFVTVNHDDDNDDDDDDDEDDDDDCVCASTRVFRSKFYSL